jgi:hypothetical protein
MPKKYDSSKRRLGAIEGKREKVTIRLTFPDGSTRGVDVARDFHLQVFLHIASKLRSYPPQPPEGIVLPPPPPEPSTPSDRLIDLMAAAESVEGPRLFQTIFGMCSTLGERRRQRGKNGSETAER